MMTLLSWGFYNNNNICNCRGVLLSNKVNVLEGKLPECSHVENMLSESNIS